MRVDASNARDRSLEHLKHVHSVGTSRKGIHMLKNLSAHNPVQPGKGRIKRGGPSRHESSQHPTSGLPSTALCDCDQL